MVSCGKRRVLRAFRLLLYIAPSRLVISSDVDLPQISPLSIGNIQIRLQQSDAEEAATVINNGNIVNQEERSESFQSILNQFKQDVQQINDQYRSELKQIILDITEQIRQARQRNQAHRRNATETHEKQIESSVNVTNNVDEEVIAQVDGTVEIPEVITSDTVESDDIALVIDAPADNDAVLVDEPTTDPIAMETLEAASVVHTNDESETLVAADLDDDTIDIEVETISLYDGASSHGTEDLSDVVSIHELDSDTVMDVCQNHDESDHSTHATDIVESTENMENIEKVMDSSKEGSQTNVMFTRKRKKRKTRQASPDSLPAFVAPKNPTSFLAFKQNDISSILLDDDDDNALEIIEDDDTSDTDLVLEDEPVTVHATVRLVIRTAIHAVVTALVMGMLYTIVQRLIAILLGILVPKKLSSSSPSTGIASKAPPNGKAILLPQP